MALSAQTPPMRFPRVPQFTVTPQAPGVRPKTQVILRQLFNRGNPEETGVCSIPLLEVPVAKNVEQMPVFRPRAANVDHMPSVKLPGPPCEEAQR